MPQLSCDHCDGPGGVVTIDNQIPMVINGKVCGIDFCIYPLVRALNEGGIRTVASCCGHQEMNGLITLADDRSLVILPRTIDDDGTLNKAVYNLIKT